jgi:hypothetical protein
MRVATFTESAPNVIVIRFEPGCGNCTKEDFTNYLLEFSELFKREHPFNILLDGRDVQSLPTRYAMQHGFFFVKNKKSTERLIEKSAIVLNSKTVRKILNIVFTIYTPKSDLIITKDIEEAAMHVANQTTNVSS